MFAYPKLCGCNYQIQIVKLKRQIWMYSLFEVIRTEAEARNLEFREK
jgi:hypothetical protein